MFKQYWCECGAEPKIQTGNEVKYCPVCGGYKTLHIRREDSNKNKVKTKG